MFTLVLFKLFWLLSNPKCQPPGVDLDIHYTLILPHGMFHVRFITSSELFLFIGSHRKFKYKPERGDYEHPQATGPPSTMRMNVVSSSLTLALLTRSTLAGGFYSLTENIVGYGFYDSFNFEAIPDPTNGRVYVALTTHNVFLSFID